MDHIYKNIQGWFTWPNFYRELITQAKDNSHIVEIGTWKGQSASFIAVEIINSRKRIKFDCVDTWLGSEEHKDKNSQFYEPLLETEDGVYNEFLKNIKEVKHVINAIRLPSEQAYKNYKDESVDCVFIDGSHDYQSIKNDIINWFPIVKSGGIISGHDFHHPHIKRAPEELFKNVISTDEDIWIYNKTLV